MKHTRDDRVLVIVDAIRDAVFEHPVRVVTKPGPDGSGQYANLIDANGRHMLAERIVDALDRLAAVPA